jgi:signal transduction histidine kinase
VRAGLTAREWADDALKGVGWFAVGLVLLLVVPAVRTVWWPGAPPSPTWIGLAVLAFACTGEALRRARPLLGLLIAGLALLSGPLLVGDTHLGVLLVFGDLLYCAVLHSSARVSRLVCWASGALIAVFVLVSLVSGGAQAAVLMVLNLSLLAIPVMWGREVRHHREQADVERDRAVQAHRMADLDRTAAVAAERARMARDLHDVIAGQLSGIAIQSEAALTLADPDPATLRRVLTAVRRDSVASLTEMRTMIGLLRADGAADSEPRTAPAGLAGLAALLDAASNTGLVVEVDDRRPPDADVPAAVDLAAYRIVQESLTNAAKHAPGSTARLVLRRDAAALVVELENDLVPDAPAAGGTGTGLLGLRERAAALGGRIDAGAHGRTWRLRAELPVTVPAGQASR